MLVTSPTGFRTVGPYLPAGHPDIGTSYHNLASTCYFLQDLDNALLYEQKGYDILQAQLPAGHPHMQTVKSSFAFLYSTRGERRQAAGQYEGAIEDLKKALEFRPDSEETKRRIKQIEAARGRGVKAGAGSESFALSSKGSPEEQPAPAEEHFGFFRVTKATSLREGPTSSSKVLRRLSPGDSLRVLEKTEYYWWKVDDNGKVGYVKALLLEQ